MCDPLLSNKGWSEFAPEDSKRSKSPFSKESLNCIAGNMDVFDSMLKKDKTPRKKMTHDETKSDIFGVRDLTFESPPRRRMRSKIPATVARLSPLLIDICVSAAYDGGSSNISKNLGSSRSLSAI